MISSRRFQQNAFAAAAATNRTVGPGAGSGLQGLFYLGGARNSSGFTTGSTSDVLITNVAFSFTLSRASFVAWSANDTGKTSGSTGTYAYVSVYTDGSTDGLIHLIDKGVGGYTMGSVFTFATLAPLAAGLHTIDMRAHVDSGQTYLSYSTGFGIYLVSP